MQSCHDSDHVTRNLSLSDIYHSRTLGKASYVYYWTVTHRGSELENHGMANTRDMLDVTSQLVLASTMESLLVYGLYIFLVVKLYTQIKESL